MEDELEELANNKGQEGLAHQMEEEGAEVQIGRQSARWGEGIFLHLEYLIFGPYLFGWVE